MPPRGSGTVIASGGIQSNDSRVTAAAYARNKVDCELVLAPLVSETDDDYRRNRNTILNDLVGYTSLGEVRLLPRTMFVRQAFSTLWG